MRFLGVLALTVILAVFGASAAGAQTDGLVYSEDTIFTVRGDEVDVETVAVMSNTTNEQRRGDTVYYSYFDSLIIVVPTGAQDLKIVSRGSELSSTVSEIDSDFEVRAAQLPTELRSGQTREFTVTYSLPLGELRGDGVFFSNPAFHAFPLWSFSDPGTGSLLLRIPENSSLTEFGDVLRRTGFNDGYVEWAPRSFDQPAELFTFVTVTIEERLDTQRFTVAGQEIELRTWPGDNEWSSFAKQTITDGLPELEELIGLPVPDQSVLEVTSSANPYFYGYAGWYDPLETSIEIGNELDSGVMIHELSHAWFNDGLFAERWISEGLAEEFAWQAQSSLNWESEDIPDQPDLTAANAGPLIEWSRTAAAGVDDSAFRAREEYGYSASWYVVRELVEIIGLDQLQFVIRAANDDLSSYPDSNPNETTFARDDWKRVLDLASVDASAEEAAALDDLFITYVVAERHVATIEQRRSSRNRYARFASDDNGWAVPIEIRWAMEGWRFEEAGELMAEASVVHARYDEVVTLATDAELNLSIAARTAYERNGTDFEFALRVLDAQEAAIGDVEGVRRGATRQLTTEEAWGLRDVSLAPYVNLAERAFANDDRAGIANAQKQLDAKLVEAIIVGRDRLFWAVLGAAALAVMGVQVVWMFVRRRRASDPTVNFDVELIEQDEFASETGELVSAS